MQDADVFTEIYTFITDTGDKNSDIPASEVMNNESLFYELCENIDVYRSCHDVNSKFNPESEETVEVLGKEFVKQKGTFHGEGMDGPVEMTYVAYFGLMDFKEDDYTNCPTMWIALSERNDDATKAQLEKRVDTAAQNMKYTK